MRGGERSGSPWLGSQPTVDGHGSAGRAATATPPFPAGFFDRYDDEPDGDVLRAAAAGHPHRRRGDRRGRPAVHRARADRRRARPDVVVGVALRAAAGEADGARHERRRTGPQPRRDGGRRARPQRRSAPAVRRRHVRRRDVLRVRRLPRPSGRGVRRRRPGAAAGRAVRVHVLQPLLPDEGDQGLAGQRRPRPAGHRATPTSSRAAASTGPHAGPPQPGRAGATRCTPRGRPGAPGRDDAPATAGRAGGRRRRLPGLPATRRVARGGRRREAGGVPRRDVLGPADARLRRPGGADRRPRAGARRPTAPTAPAGCSPATAAATGCSGRCTGPAWRTSRRRRTPATGCACTTRGSRRRSSARRRPTVRRRPSATPARRS